MTTQVKKILHNNPKLIEDILVDIGCHKISMNPKEIRCALPDGDNPTSVQIRLDEFLPCRVYTRNKFNDYDFTDIFTLICFIKKYDFEKSIEYVCSKLGLKYSSAAKFTNFELLNELRKKKRIIKKYKPVEHTILDPEILEKYEVVNIKEWEEEGISFGTQQKYGIRYDKTKNRIVIPIYDENYNLIGLKGRTRHKSWKELRICKYWHYYELGTNDILFGLNFHKDDIKQKNEVIVFEGEKSVMKAEEYGFYNTIAVATNTISNIHLAKILSLNCNVVIAFDKYDEKREANTYRNLLKEANKLTRYTNVSIIYDKENLLDYKDAPVDKGRKVWKKLYENKIKVN